MPDIFDHRYAVPFPPSLAGQVSETLRDAGFHPAWIAGQDGARYAVKETGDAVYVWIVWPSHPAEARERVMRTVRPVLEAAGYRLGWSAEVATIVVRRGR